jgi:hypothetical protein
MSGSVTIQGNSAAFATGTVDFTETMAAVKAGMKDTTPLLTVSFLASPAGEVPGPIRLEPPKTPAMDPSLQLAQLQDTLNQLMQKVSVNDIKQNLQAQNDANKQQLEKMQEGAKAAAAAAAKSKEAEKTKNLWSAVAQWVGAAITIASMVATVVAAVGMLATGNFVSAGALIVATAAMGVQLACQVTLAVDATMKATGKEGFLSPETMKTLQKTMEIAGYVALAASMVGLIGGLVSAGSSAAGQVTTKIAAKGATEVAEEAGKKVAKEAAEEVATKVASEAAEGAGNKVASEVVKEAGQEAAEEVAKRTVKDVLIQAAKNSYRIGGLGNFAQAGVQFAGKQTELKARAEASDLQKEADLKEAEAEALKAMITKLQAMIQQLQADLEEQMEKGENVLQSLLTPITDRMKTMETLVQNLGA